jgi:serine/threonine protein kinase/Flp pilus assembly protein TadD
MATLSTEQLARMSRLLDEVVDADDAAREAWLRALPDAHRDLEPALRQALFASAGNAPRLDTLPRLGEPAGELKAGNRVGPYRLVRPLGRGGMAEVWLARRADGAFQREVALKTPSRREARDALASRFAVERDILAALEHPRIARFYDAGVGEDGRPYHALEYVPGRNLLHWADAQRLGIAARIELFLQVLDGVQYAHDKGVLHRDIKPGNVLVTDAGQAHLLDFGVSRVIGPQAGPDVTQAHGPALTPAYASPERLQGDGLDATADVYSLGVVLYELLCGRHPHGAAPRTAGADPAIARPSTRIDDTTAALRGSTAKRLQRALAGDLDAIALKAMAASPSQRYASAAALGQDLRRHLAREPVEAVPPSWPYRARKFFARHGTGVAQGDVYASGPFERDAERAEVTFRKAAALAPTDALPWAKLAMLHLGRAAWQPSTRDEHHALAREAVETALQIDPNSVAAQAARFRYAVAAEHRWADARAALDVMRTIDPKDARWLPACEAHFAAVVGRLDEAIRIQRRIVEHDPQDAQAAAALARYLFHADRFDEAVAAAHRELQLNPHAAGAYGLIGVNLALLGKGDQGLAAIAHEGHPGTRWWALSVAHWTLGQRAASDAALGELRHYPKGNAYAIAELYALRGQRGAAFEWLNRACLERQGGCEGLRADRFLRALRDDPRHRALLAKMKLDRAPTLD